MYELFLPLFKCILEFTECCRRLGMVFASLKFVDCKWGIVGVCDHLKLLKGEHQTALIYISISICWIYV